MIGHRLRRTFVYNLWKNLGSSINYTDSKFVAINPLKSWIEGDKRAINQSELTLLKSTKTKTN